ncbi:hypothetical protein V2J56_09125 [Georgenia sp. MJ206]|uniref:hypothetical protein n=1 Tax=Georgenia wangjunii TaxID=3117730 RepID=UPI002F265A84
MKRADISDEHVLDLARAWRDARAPVEEMLSRMQSGQPPRGTPGVVAALVGEGVPEKVALRKVEHMVDRGLLDYGTTPYLAWPVDTPEVPDRTTRL